MTEFLQIIGALGIGGVISSYLTILWQNKQENRKKHQQQKETRYKCISMLMHAHINFNNNISVLNKYDYDISSPEDLEDLLQAEQMNSYIYASNGFIEKFNNFLKNPSDKTRLEVMKEIRKDLWKLK